VTLEGVLVIEASRHRSQDRRATRPTRGSKERRLEGKARRGGVKKLRTEKPRPD
jgi:ribosome-associated protein